MNVSIKNLVLIILVIYSLLLSLLLYYSYHGYRVVIVSPSDNYPQPIPEKPGFLSEHEKSSLSQSSQVKNKIESLTIQPEIRRSPEVQNTATQAENKFTQEPIQLTQTTTEVKIPQKLDQPEIDMTQKFTELDLTHNTETEQNPKIDVEVNQINNEVIATPTDILTDSRSQCIAHNYGFTAEEEKEIFNYNTYGKCKVPTKDEITYEDGKLYVKCQSNKSPLYFTDLSPYQKYGGSTKSIPRWSKFIPNIDKKEFVLVRCSENAIYTVVFNRYDKKKSQAANEIRDKLEPTNKNMNVFVLLFDSVSRYSAERNLPLTLEFLKTIQNSQFSESFSVYDFEKPGIPVPFTKDNEAQIIFGKTVEDIEKIVGNKRLSMLASSEKHIKFQKKAIWSHFTKMGYVTMFIHDSVWDYTSMITGRDIMTDHVFTNIWRYLYGAYKWHNFSNSQRCAGNKNSHELSFEYTYQYFDNYKKNNKFAYVHLDAAHESTGNIRTVDADLVKFLKKFLMMITEKNENLALFLMSDHGIKRFKDAQFDYRFYFEAMVPMTYLILSKEIESQWNIKETLIHNQNQLVSRFDINLSLKHISYFPYKISFGDVYSKLQSYYGLPGVVSLFKEKLDTTRTCSDIGVAREYCLCNWYEKVEQNKNELQIQKYIKELVKQYFQNFHADTYKCESFKNFDVLSDFSFPLKTYEEGWDTLYKLELVTLKGFMIEVEANFCLETKILKTNKILKGNEYPYKIASINKQNVFIQITKVLVNENCKIDLCKC